MYTPYVVLMQIAFWTANGLRHHVRDLAEVWTALYFAVREGRPSKINVGSRMKPMGYNVARCADDMPRAPIVIPRAMVYVVGSAEQVYFGHESG